MNDQNEIYPEEIPDSQPERQEPVIEEVPETDPSDEPTAENSVNAKPQYWVPIVLVLLATLVLGMWVISGRKPAQVATPEPELPTLNAPHVTLEAQRTEPITLALTETAVIPTPIPTVAPRTEVTTYTIEPGDNIATIAIKFGIRPDTILWANRYNLGFELDAYVPGQQITILPIDGVYHQWSAGEGLNGVSSAYGVTPDAIIDYPGNHLDRASLGDLGNPNIQPGTMLIIPGGERPERVPDHLLLTAVARQTLNDLPVGTPETFPAPRNQVIAYEIQEQDTIYTIAEKFGLEPETILWANRYIMGDTPDGIYPGGKLIILPVDGVYHGWSYEEGLNGVAGFYKVSPDAIVDYPLNELDRTTVGDYANPNIKAGTMLIVPGGSGAEITWVTAVAPDSPAGTHPNVSYLGTAACNSTAWAVGSGNFVHPTTEMWLSGYDFNPPVHNGVDYAGRMGYNIFAADTGVVIYSGWSNRGYGYTVVINHGNGYLTLYAHLMENGITVPCGSIVTAGQLIGYMGSTGQSTGPHLHFEIRSNGSAVNPWNFGIVNAGRPE